MENNAWMRALAHGRKNKPHACEVRSFKGWWSFIRWDSRRDRKLFLRHSVNFWLRHEWNILQLNSSFIFELKFSNKKLILLVTKLIDSQVWSNIFHDKICWILFMLKRFSEIAVKIFSKLLDKLRLRVFFIQSIPISWMQRSKKLKLQNFAICISSNEFDKYEKRGKFYALLVLFRSIEATTIDKRSS